MAPSVLTLSTKCRDETGRWRTSGWAAKTPFSVVADEPGVGSLVGPSSGAAVAARQDSAENVRPALAQVWHEWHGMFSVGPGDNISGGRTPHIEVVLLTAVPRQELRL